MHALKTTAGKARVTQIHPDAFPVAPEKDSALHQGKSEHFCGLPSIPSLSWPLYSLNFASIRFREKSRAIFREYKISRF